MPFFNTFNLLPEDPILGLLPLFNADPRELKVNLGIGAYRDADGKPQILSCVKKAEALLLEKSRDKEYLPIEGDKQFVSESLKLLFSDSLPHNNIAAAQSIGGSGALRVAAEMLLKGNLERIFIPDPSWPNHNTLFLRSGLKIETYPYYDPQQHGIPFDRLCDAITHMPPQSIILFHGCCHNPTGIDFSFSQWQELQALLKKQNLLPFFDLAYQGFGENLDADAAAIRYFAKQGDEFIVASSYSKNMGLYGERLGLLAIVTSGADVARKVTSHLKLTIRGNYSTPPLHGAKIAALVLSDPALRQEWEKELKQMRDRIQSMRQQLAAGLTSSTHRDFGYLANQKGIFSYTGLSAEQVLRLRNEYGIYMPTDGRINVAGLNPHNLNHVIHAIVTVL